MENKRKFEVKRNLDGGIVQQAVFIDGQKFDWEVDAESLQWAMQQGPEIFAATQKDIQKHFLECLSEFVGRPVKQEDVVKASQTGWI